jgi:hypothetical protein
MTDVRICRPRLARRCTFGSTDLEQDWNCCTDIHNKKYHKTQFNDTSYGRMAIPAPALSGAKKGAILPTIYAGRTF